MTLLINALDSNILQVFFVYCVPHPRKIDLNSAYMYSSLKSSEYNVDKIFKITRDLKDVHSVCKY